MIKRKEEIENVEIKEEPKVEEEKVVNIDNENIKVSKNKLVDEEGFAISDTKVENPEEVTDLFVEIEKYRQKYLKAATFSKYISIGIMLFAIVLVVVFWIFMNKLPNIWRYVLLGVAIALVIGILGYNIFKKKRLNNLASEYVQNYYQATIKYLFDDQEKFSLVTVNPKGKLANDFFTEAKLYDGIVSCGSRNVTSFIYNNQEFVYAELAAEIQGVKKLEPTFVGKVLKVRTNIELHGRTIIQINGKSKLTVPINSIAGLEEIKIKDHDNIKVYSSLSKKESFVFNKKLVDKLISYKLDDNLFDVVISIYNENILIGLDYNDSVMQLPVDKKFDMKLIDEIKEAVLNSIEICRLIEEGLASKVVEKETTIKDE